MLPVIAACLDRLTKNFNSGHPTPKIYNINFLLCSEIFSLKIHYHSEPNKDSRDAPLIGFSEMWKNSAKPLAKM